MRASYIFYCTYVAYYRIIYELYAMIEVGGLTEDDVFPIFLSSLSIPQPNVIGAREEAAEDFRRLQKIVFVEFP